jgi:hypothetical protein
MADVNGAEAPTREEIETVRDTVRAVAEELSNAEGAEPADTGEVSGAEPEPTSEAGRESDEFGRFVSKEAEAAEAGTEPAEEAPEAEAAEAPEPQEAAPEAPEPVETATEGEALEPPTHWSLEEQEAFRAVPEEHQTALLGAVGRAEELAKQADQVVGEFERIGQVIAPRREAWARSGMTEEQALTQVLALSDWATTEPINFARYFIKQRGIPASELFDLSGMARAEPEDPNAYVDPDIKALKDQLQGLQGTIAQQNQQLQRFTQNSAQQEEQARQAELDGVRRNIEAFASAADESGALSHPYFSQVEGAMTALLQSGTAQGLDDAYDMACRAHPEVHAKIAAAANAKAKREQAAQARKKAEAAKKAGASISGSPGGGNAAAAPTDDVREDMKAQFQERGML